MTELRGCLRNLGLVPFMEFLSQQGRTGQLKISRADLQGEIAFNHGRIASVAMGDERGQAALEIIALALADGDFVYADATSNAADPDLTAETDGLRIELQDFINTTRREAGPLLSLVPRFLNPGGDLEGDDEELELSRTDIAVLMGVDGRRTTAELMRGRPTMHALHTLTHLSELGVIQLAPPEARTIPEQTSVPSPAVETSTSVGVTDQAPAPSHALRSAETDHLVVRPARRLPWVREVVRVLVLTAVFALLFRALIQSVHVEGQSMLPGLHQGEMLLVDRTAYFHDERSVVADVLPFTAQGAMRYPRGGPRRGDVVVFYSPVEPSVELVKRIAGLPGENVRITNGQLFVNDTPLHEPYIASSAPDTGSYPENAQFIHIPDDSYFVLGDNRTVSQDSRQGWLVQASDLVGRAWLTYWPPSAWGLVRQLEPLQLLTPVPSSAPAAVPTTPSTAAPTLRTAPEAPAPVPQPRLLLSGAVGNQIGWPTDPTGTARFDGPAYRLSANQATHFVAVASPVTDLLTDVAVTAVFHKVGGPPGGGYGIIVRDQGPWPRDGNNQRGYFYVAEVGDLGEIGIWRRDDDHWVDLVPWTSSTAVNGGGTTNELTLRAEGSRLIFSVNGRQVVAVDDAALPFGRVGAFVGGDFNDVVLDRFSLEAPPGAVDE